MIDFLLPSLGADMDEAKLVRWLVEPGHTVHKGQIIAEVETDKAVLEVECWDEGVIDELVMAPGPARLAVGTLLARIRPSHEVQPESVAAGAGTPAAEPAPPGPVLAAEAVAEAAMMAQPAPPIRHLAHQLGVDLADVRGTGPGGVVTRDDVRGAARPAPPEEARVKATPRARQRARELGVAIGTVRGTGAEGLITVADVEAVPAGGPAPAAVPAAGLAEAPLPEEGAATKVEAMRRAIARSMTHSKREIPHYYLATRIDLGRALSWLDGYNAERPITGRVLPAALLLKATALAVRETPGLNGHWIDDRFRPSDPVHLGVAISLREGGLVAPAIHDADRLDLDEMMVRLRDLVNRARSWRLRSSEMSDPTITVTNLGDRGVETAFPIIVPPQVAMVGFGKVVDTPVAVGGLIGIAPIVHATLSADHRVTDGHRGGLLLMALDRLLQEPEKL